MCNKNLGEEFREAMEDAKRLMLRSTIESLEYANDDDIVTRVKTFRVFNRLSDAFVEMFEKLDRLADKNGQAPDWEQM